MPTNSDLPDADDAPPISRQYPVMPLEWGAFYVPQISQRVRVTSPDRGYGRVTGFFAAQGQLGVYVNLETPPGPATRGRASRRQAQVFGHELEFEPGAD